MTQRFLTLTDVAETLNITMAQTKALVRSGSLVGVKLGGRGVWRVEDVQLEAFIERAYEQTRRAVEGDQFMAGHEDLADLGEIDSGAGGDATDGPAGGP